MQCVGGLSHMCIVSNIMDERPCLILLVVSLQSLFLYDELQSESPRLGSAKTKLW